MHSEPTDALAADVERLRSAAERVAREHLPLWLAALVVTSLGSGSLAVLVLPPAVGAVCAATTILAAATTFYARREMRRTHDGYVRQREIAHMALRDLLDARPDPQSIRPDRAHLIAALDNAANWNPEPADPEEVLQAARIKVLHERIRARREAGRLSPSHEMSHDQPQTAVSLRT